MGDGFKFQVKVLTIKCLHILCYAKFRRLFNIFTSFKAHANVT